MLWLSKIAQLTFVWMQVYSRDDACKMRPPPPEEALTAKERVEAQADGVLKEGYKPFSPSSYTKWGAADGTFNKFPEYSSDPYSEKLLRYVVPRMRSSPFFWT